MARMGETAAREVPRFSGGRRADQDELASTDELKARLRSLLDTLLDRLFGLALEQVEALGAWFDEIAARGGVRVNALLGGARAALVGRSPVWGAVRGAFAGMSPEAKIAVIVALVLAVLLLPLTVVLVLLALIVAAIVVAATAASRAH
jgi:membrane associated rhomboid family serine protease